MALVTLNGADWGFDDTCFVCGGANGHGLGLAYALDDGGEAPRVVATFTPAPQHTGAPNTVHGGVVSAVLDDGMAWCVVAIVRRLGLTRRAEVEFARPLRPGRTYAVECGVEERDGDRAITRGAVRDADGRVCATMRAEFALLPEDTPRGGS